MLGSGVESVVTESIFRGRILLEPTARASVALEYQVRSASNAWNLTVPGERGSRCEKHIDRTPHLWQTARPPLSLEGTDS